MRRLNALRAVLMMSVGFTTWRAIEQVIAQAWLDANVTRLEEAA